MLSRVNASDGTRIQGASFGYHAGGWGKPPVDEQGKPLYGDVFGIQQQEAPVVEEDEQIESQPWGELESESEEESESEVCGTMSRNIFVICQEMNVWASSLKINVQTGCYG